MNKEFLKALLTSLTINKIMVSLAVVSVTTFVAVKTSVFSSNTSDTPAEINEEDSSQQLSENEKTDIQNSTQKKRVPASEYPSGMNLSPKVTDKKNSQFVNVDNARSTPLNNNESDTNGSGVSSGYQSILSPIIPNSPLAAEDLFDNSEPENPITKDKEKDNFVEAKVSSAGPSVNIKKSSTSSTSTTTTTDTPSGSGDVPVTNTCTANIVGGTFGNAVGITLDCSYNSTISYCLSSGACCDPATSGTVYTVPIVIGPSSGTYCLSYSGDSVTGGTSIVYDQTYVINTTYPNLTVAHEKLYYQTTELIGTSFISSNDFNKPNYSVGQINLKLHDPGPSGLDYDCDEIMDNYAGLVTPAPLDILTLFDVSGIPNTSQVEIPLLLNQLDYGENFITSYIVNNNVTPAHYSCATSKIVLDDFEYFEPLMAQAETGTNTVREFEGQFTSFGFFEPSIATQTSRAPAGENFEEKSGQNLKNGIFGMFY